MSNSLTVGRTQDAVQALKMMTADKSINTMSRRSGIGITQEASSNGNDKDIDPEDVRLKEKTKEFEKIMITYMIKEMWETIPEDEDSEGHGTQIYTEMMQSALAEKLADGGGFGIAKMMSRQLKTSE